MYLAGLSLNSSLAGKQALNELAQMHGTEFPLVDGWVGHYGGGQATLWVAVSSDSTGATQLLASMRDKISWGNTPFTPVAELLDGNRTIYELSGLDQEHFYFRSGKLLIWLATDEEIAQKAIRDAVEFYP